MPPLTQIEKDRLRRKRRDIRKQRKRWWSKYWNTVFSGSITAIVCAIGLGVFVYSRIWKPTPVARVDPTPVQWAETAFAAYEKGDGDAAIEAMENVSDSDSPYRFAANRWLAELLVTGQMHRKSSLGALAVAAHMQRSVRDGDVDALVASGLSEFAIGAREKAVSFWSRATKNDPPRRDVLLPLAWELQSTGRASEADGLLDRSESFYRSAIGDGSETDLTYIALIETLIAEEKLDDAESVRRAARQAFVNDDDSRRSAWLDHALARITMQRIADATLDESLSTLRNSVPQIPNSVAVWRAWFRLRSQHAGVLTDSQLSWATDYGTRPAYRIAASQVALDRDVQVDPKAIRMLAEVYASCIDDVGGDSNAVHMLCRTVVRASGLPELLLGVAEVDIDGLNVLPTEPLAELTDGKITTTVTETMFNLVTENPDRADYRQTLALALARDQQYGMAIPMLQTASYLHPRDRWVHEILALSQEATSAAESTEQTRRYIRENCEDRIVLMPTVDPSKGIRMIEMSRALFRGLSVKPAVSLETWDDPERPGQLGSERLDWSYLRLLYEPAWSPSEVVADSAVEDQ